MTDAAKPTPGPWYFCPYPAGNGGFVYAGGPGGPSICDVSQYELPEQNGEFIAEAGTVFHETGLTPRKLLEQRDELQERVKELEEALVGAEKELSVWHESIKRGELAWYDALERGEVPFFGLERIRAALADARRKK